MFRTSPTGSPGSPVFSLEGGRAIKICPKDRTEYGEEDINYCPLCGTKLVTVGLRKGEVVGGSYRIIDLLGRGWAGSVYRAEHSMMGRPTALKIISSPVVADPAFVERFRQAAHMLSDLDSPHVAIVHDLGIDPPNRIYIASEFVAGRSLAKIVADDGPMSAQRFLDVMRVVLEGLKAAHAMGVIHGSVKPANIIVTDDAGGARIVDFGTQRIVSALQDEVFAAKTSYGNVYGELAYLAPEQISGGQVDARADIYSLGLTMYEALTGARPFPQENADELAKAQVEQEPVSPREARPQLKIPKFIDKAVMQALEKKPRRRQQSAAEFLDQLRAEIVPEEEEARSVWARAKAAVVPRPVKEAAPVEPPAPPEPAGPVEPMEVGPEPEVAKPQAMTPAGVARQAAARAAGEPAHAPEAAPAGAPEVTGPRLILYKGKEVVAVWPIDKPNMTVGRSPEADIMLDDKSISRSHATIVRRPDKIVVKDHSTNGTYINNDRVLRGHIEDKDEVAFGNIALIFRTT